MKRLIWLFTGCFAMLIPLSGQGKNYSVIDETTLQPVPFVTVAIEKNNIKKYLLADENGKFNLNEEFPYKLTITATGYKEYSITPDSLYVDVIRLTPSVFNLDEVVVTGQFSSRKSDQSIYEVTVLSKKEIEQKAATNLSGLLNNELNINLNMDGVIGRSLSLRGLGGEHIKILIDGVPVVGRQNGIIDLDQLNLTNVDHVEIVEGPLSVIYGSNALGGVINIITRQSTADKIYVETNAYYETVGIYNFDVNFHKKFGNHSLGVHATRNFFSGYDPDSESRYKTWKPKVQYFPGFNYSYSGKKMNLSSKIEFLHEELRDKGRVIPFDSSTTDKYYFTKRLNSSITADFKPGSNSKIQATAGYSYFNKRKNSYTINLVNLEEHLSSDSMLQDTTFFHQVTQRTIYSYSGNKWELMTGYDLNYEYGEGKRVRGTQDIGDYALFGSVIYSPFSKIHLQPGVRLLYNTKYNTPVVYSLNLKYEPGNFRFRAAYSKGFRTPSLKELYLEFVDMNHNVFGNEDLKAENANTWLVSGSYIGSYEMHKFEFSVDLYYNKINNKIDFLYDYTYSPVLAQYFNLSDLVTKGIETEINYHLYPGINIKAGWTLSAGSALHDIDLFRPSNDFNGSLSYFNQKYRFRITTLFKFTDKRIFYIKEFNPDLNRDEIREKYIEGYQNLDLNFTVPLFRNKITLSAGIKNVFDYVTVFSTGNTSDHGYEEGDLPVSWGRTGFIKLSYRFLKYE